MTSDGAPGHPPMTTPPEPVDSIPLLPTAQAIVIRDLRDRLALAERSQNEIDIMRVTINSQKEWIDGCHRELKAKDERLATAEQESVAAFIEHQRAERYEAGLRGEITALQERLALAEANNERLASDVSRMSVDAAHREQEAVAAFHEAKALKRQLAQLDQANVTLSGQNTDLADRLALAEAERDRLGVLDTVLKERRHHPDCPYKRECNCWLAAALTHRHDADLASLALAEQALEQAGHHEDRLLKSIEFVIRTFDSEDISPTPDQRDVIDDLRSALRHHKRLDETTPPVSTEL